MKTFKIYNSVADLSAALKSKKPFYCWDNPISERSESYMKSWAGASVEEAYELLDTGDATGAAKIKAEGEIIADEQGENVSQIISCVVGCIPSVPNYIIGVPKQMLKVVREPKNTPIIDMYVDGAIWDGVDVNKAAKAAAKIANVITATELAGVRVNLYAVCASTKNSDCACMAVKLKDDDAPLNLLNVAFPLTNRAFCRVIYLDWFEKHHNKEMKNYGSVMSARRVKEEFEFDGLVLSVSDIISNEISVEQIANKVNEYIKNKERDE